MMMMQMLEIQIISFSDHFSSKRFMVVDIFDYDVDYVRQPKVIHNNFFHSYSTLNVFIRKIGYMSCLPLLAIVQRHHALKMAN